MEKRLEVNILSFMFMGTSSHWLTPSIVSLHTFIILALFEVHNVFLKTFSFFSWVSFDVVF